MLSRSLRGQQNRVSSAFGLAPVLGLAGRSVKDPKMPFAAIGVVFAMPIGFVGALGPTATGFHLALLD